jgi:hypothetical protein
VDDGATHNRLDKPGIWSRAARSRKDEAYWDGKLGGSLAFKELRATLGTDLTSFSLAYSKSLRTLSPVRTPAWDGARETK